MFTMSVRKMTAERMPRVRCIVFRRSIWNQSAKADCRTLNSLVIKTTM